MGADTRPFMDKRRRTSTTATSAKSPTTATSAKSPTTATMTAAAAVVVVTIVWASICCTPADASRWCYKCGLGYGDEPDCNTFMTSGTWVPYHLEYPDDYLCVKVVNAWNTSDESKALRGGVRGTTLSGVSHKVGCWANKKSYALICYCDTNLCNAASALYSPEVLAHAPVLLVLFTLLLLSAYVLRW